MMARMARTVRLPISERMATGGSDLQTPESRLPVPTVSMAKKARMEKMAKHLISGKMATGGSEMKTPE